MKNLTLLYQHNSFLQIVSICLMLVILLPGLPVNAEPTYSKQAISTATNNKTVTSDLNTTHAKNTHTKKKVLIDDSRELSAFFILGIAINIIMIIAFARWFAGQWRQSKK